MRRIIFALGLIGVVLLLVLNILPEPSAERTPLEHLRAEYKVTHKPSVDHSKFDALEGPFASPQEVTKACISCHTERHKEVMQSSHWNWDRIEYIDGVGIRKVGKKNILNNFCIGISGNEQSCNRCHIGYGYHDDSFNFGNAYNVDCLACHDQSNLYMKAGAGMPDPSVDLASVAKEVGKPTRTNCGTCHFFGGGGNNVKHGDLDMAMFEPSRDLDVHMAVEGSNMQCVACHTAEQHQMLGKSYSVSSMNRDRVSCESCHGDLPHADKILNNHTLKVACQTCHIPTYAKENPTKLEWDWSTAGQLQDGKPFAIEDDSLGVDTYMSIKGSFVWGKNIEPEYAWFNGTASHYLIGDTFDAQDTLQINTLRGTYSDPDAKIIPVKVHRAKQIYDKKHDYLIQPKTVSTHPGDSAYWKEFDWDKACAAGMREVGLPYSGEYGFVNTEMYWPVNHMVAPANKSLTCAECHTRSDGRLAGLTDFYMPGRDRNAWVERAGVGLLVLTLLGVLAHGSARYIILRRRGGGAK
ncbi:MAG: tetrathionate reductase family octaheme c-type cytochrome [Calditrichaeota bacterium]|nr:tetrathionate reductase family octaheme c-type cytochrome [Calditrichota bacterium]MCB9367094.1 tetrathionate reductase family octaheme c-type cytochrome [Calditrichota bacterium]